MIEEHILICQCHNPEHQVIVARDNDKCVYFMIHLVPERNIFKRIINGIKYIFGYRSKYGEFDEFILKDEDKTKIVNLITKTVNFD